MPSKPFVLEMKPNTCFSFSISCIPCRQSDHRKNHGGMFICPTQSFFLGHKRCVQKLGKQVAAPALTGGSMCTRNLLGQLVLRAQWNRLSTICHTNNDLKLDSCQWLISSNHAAQLLWQVATRTCVKCNVFSSFCTVLLLFLLL